MRGDWVIFPRSSGTLVAETMHSSQCKSRKLQVKELSTIRLHQQQVLLFLPILGNPCSHNVYKLWEH